MGVYFEYYSLFPIVPLAPNAATARDCSSGSGNTLTIRFKAEGMVSDANAPLTARRANIAILFLIKPMMTLMIARIDIPVVKASSINCSRYQFPYSGYYID